MLVPITRCGFLFPALVLACMTVLCRSHPQVTMSVDEYFRLCQNPITDLGSSYSNPGESCRQIKQLGFDRGSKIYYINPLGKRPFPVYCDMTTLGGGWTLVLNQIGSRATYYTLNDASCTNLRALSSQGRQCQVDRIFRSATEIRYTDEREATFLHAAFNGADYWKAIHSTVSTPVQVRYVSGPLAGPVRYIEVRDIFHWGHRNNNPTVGGKRTGLSSYPSCKHVCWEDVQRSAYDHPFAGDHCPSSRSPSFCPGFDPDYNFPSTATRHGSMKYRKWVR